MDTSGGPACRCVCWQATCKTHERRDVAACPVCTQDTQLLERVRIGRGLLIPHPLQAIAEFDDGSQDCVTPEQLVQSLAARSIEQAGVSDEQLRVAPR